MGETLEKIKTLTTEKNSIEKEKISELELEFGRTKEKQKSKSRNPGMSR